MTLEGGPGWRIESMRVTTDADGRVVAVRAQVSGAVPPSRDVLRAVQAALLAQHGEPGDGVAVEVEHLDDASPDAADAPGASAAVPSDDDLARGPARSVRFGGLSVHRSGEQARVAVDLLVGDEVVTGEAEGRAATAARPRLVAEAALAAAADIAGVDALLESVTWHVLGRHDVVVVVLRVDEAVGARLLCGSALVGDDEERAVALALLSAVDRRLSG
jgi:hypothetical protein